jgi:glycosyltransferase involved in cell wall biosynthesis
MSDARVLRIGVDGRELVGAPTGVGRYLAALVTRWSRRPDAARRHLVLYVPAPIAREAPGALATLALDRLDVRPLPGRGGTLWEQTVLARAARRDGLDVFFAPAYTAPLAPGAPIVVAVHDVSFLAHPEWFPWLSRHRRRWVTRAVVARAARVIACSRATQLELARLLAVPAERVAVVPLGVTAPGPAPAGPAPAREPIVLFAGSVFNRRHVPDLVRAFARLAPRCPHARLVIAGENRTYPREDPAALAAALGVGDRVECRSYVSDVELAGLYRRARVFAFLSEYEGFGLTPLEALAAGVPPVVYDTPVAREVYGEAALFVAPGDVDGVARAIERLLADEVTRARVLAAAPALLARYSWERAAEATLAILEAAASGAGAPATARDAAPAARRRPRAG